MWRATTVGQLDGLLYSGGVYGPGQLDLRGDVDGQLGRNLLIEHCTFRGRGSADQAFARIRGFERVRILNCVVETPRGEPETAIGTVFDLIDCPRSIVSGNVFSRVSAVTLVSMTVPDGEEGGHSEIASNIIESGTVRTAVHVAADFVSVHGNNIGALSGQDAKIRCSRKPGGQRIRCLAVRGNSMHVAREDPTARRVAIDLAGVDVATVTGNTYAQAHEGMTFCRVADSSRVKFDPASNHVAGVTPETEFTRLHADDARMLVPWADGEPAVAVLGRESEWAPVEAR